MNSHETRGVTRGKILRILSDADGSSVRGSELCERLGVSRAAVWKAITKLKEEGYEIEAVRHDGYRLKIGNKLSAQLISKHLSDPETAQLLDVCDTTDSTNNAAKRYAAAHDSIKPIDKIFIANHQTAGKGRRGRSFYSPADTGVYISFLLAPNASAPDAVKLTTAASVAVCRAIEKVSGLRPEIKWVNDVYLNNKKICGILTEATSDLESGDVLTAVVGIGINITTESFPREITDIAGSISPSGSLDRNLLLGELINEFLSLLEVNGKTLAVKDYIEEYRGRSMVLNKNILVLNSGREAYVNAINDDGSLSVEYGDGSRDILSGGEISIRTIGVRS